MPISKPVVGARLPGTGGGAMGSPILYGFLKSGEESSCLFLLDTELTGPFVSSVDPPNVGT